MIATVTGLPGKSLLAVSACFAIFAAPGAPAQSGCAPSWAAGWFGVSGADGDVRALAWFDDGSGPKLFAGGAFSTAGQTAAANIAAWNGSDWSSVDAGMNGPVHALAVFDDGSGPALYAGGSFTQAGGSQAANLARWNGAAWSPVGGGLGGAVRALHVFDDGFGQDLYAGGEFTSAGGAFALGIARWSGAAWSSLAFGVNGTVFALTSVSFPGYRRLYAGGRFTVATSVAANNIAQWNGTSWSALAGGLGNDVLALAVYDDGGGLGLQLYAAGRFSVPAGGGLGQDHVARWNGTAWGAVPGSWAALQGDLGVSADALIVFDDGTGPALYVGGASFYAPPTAYANLMRFGPGGWSRVGLTTLDGPVHAFAAGSAGGPPVLATGGLFENYGGRAVSHVGSWTGGVWQGLGPAIDDEVAALEAFDDGNGPALCAGGRFTTAGGVAASRIARWANQAWTPLGGGVDDAVYALETFDDGSGPRLYAGGRFVTAYDGPFATLPTGASCVARWNGTGWSGLGAGIASLGFPYSAPRVNALAVYDDGTGPALYAGGSFQLAGGVPATGIARWNGTAWSAVGGVSIGWVNALLVHDDGSGPKLYVAGENGAAAPSQVMRWDGIAWTFVGSIAGPTQALATVDLGAGPRLAVAVGGNGSNVVTLWDGAAFTALPGFFYSKVQTLHAHDDGNGLALFAGGVFPDWTALGGTPARLARFDGAAWQPVGGGVGGGGTASGVSVLATFDDGYGAALYAGGTFVSAGGTASGKLARWGSARPRLRLLQAGGAGSGVTVRLENLVTGHEYLDVFSAVPCAGPPGGGPYLGLCFPDPAPLLAQILAPLGAVPFHFAAVSADVSFGPYLLPPGVTIDGLCADITGGNLGCWSAVARVAVN